MAETDAYNPEVLGAQCDTCALGPNGWLRRGCTIDSKGQVEENKNPNYQEYRPVGPEMRKYAKVAIVGQQPGPDETLEGRPFVGKSGVELNRCIESAGFLRVDTSIFNEIACQPPGLASGAYEMMSGKIDEARRKLKAYLIKNGMKKAEADIQAKLQYKHPSESCRPRLLVELKGYVNIITLGGTATSIVNGRRDSILEIAGDPATVEFDGREVKHLPTYHPSFIIRSPGYREEFINHLSKAMRFFSPSGLNWPAFDRLLASNAAELEAWFQESFALKVPFFTVDCETSKDDPLRARIDLIQFGTPDMDKDGQLTLDADNIHTKARAIAVRFISVETYNRIHSEAEEALFVAIIKRILEDRDILKVGHNLIGFDMEVFKQQWNITTRGVLDTIFLARAVWPDQRKGLKPVGRRLTDVDRWEQANVKST